MGDRRFATRMSRAEQVDLTWQDQTGQTQHCAGHLTDISASGASVRSQRPLRLGSPLSLKFQNGDLPATVKYCVRRGAVYLVGIEFQRGYRWSPELR
jgi:hypothetical protein